MALKNILYLYILCKGSIYFRDGKEEGQKKHGGTLYPTFRQPQYTRFYTFKDFCREAAEELLMVVSLLESEE